MHDELLNFLGERKLVFFGLGSSAIAFTCFGLATQGWMMYVIIGVNVLSFAVTAALNALVSKAADPREQGLAMGSLSSLNSVVAVMAPLIGTPLFARVSHYPPHDIRVGATFFLSAALNASAMLLSMWHFSRTPKTT